MPCGGIYPVQRVPGDCPNKEWDCCFFCQKNEPPPNHFVDEWDAYIHEGCVEAFLKTVEGQIVLEHGHAVTVFRDGKYVELHHGD